MKKLMIKILKIMLDKLNETISTIDEIQENLDDIELYFRCKISGEKCEINEQEALNFVNACNPKIEKIKELQKESNGWITAMIEFK